MMTRYKLTTDDGVPAGVAIAITMVATFPYRVWQGFVASTLWGWFAVPYGAPAIGTVAFAGLAILAGLVTADQKDQANMTAALVFAVLAPASALFFGWLVHLFL